MSIISAFVQCEGILWTTWKTLDDYNSAENFQILLSFSFQCCVTILAIIACCDGFSACKNNKSHLQLVRSFLQFVQKTDWWSLLSTQTTALSDSVTWCFQIISSNGRVHLVHYNYKCVVNANNVKTEPSHSKIFNIVLGRPSNLLNPKGAPHYFKISCRRQTYGQGEAQKDQSENFQISFLEYLKSIMKFGYFQDTEEHLKFEFKIAFWNFEKVLWLHTDAFNVYWLLSWPNVERKQAKGHSKHQHVRLEYLRHYFNVLNSIYQRVEKRTANFKVHEESWIWPVLWDHFLYFSIS